MRKRELKLENYGISNKRFWELRSFCEQYPDWKLYLENKTDTMKSKQITDMPIVQSGNGDDTSNLAIKRAEYSTKCELVEKTARKASDDLWEYLIKSVCYEQPFWYLRDVMNIPCSRCTFYDTRRYFFFLLDKAKK